MLITIKIIYLKKEKEVKTRDQSEKKNFNSIDNIITTYIIVFNYL